MRNWDCSDYCLVLTYYIYYSHLVRRSLVFFTTLNHESIGEIMPNKCSPRIKPNYPDSVQNGIEPQVCLQP